eukprot:1624607-Rhodomonas_salina.5
MGKMQHYNSAKGHTTRGTPTFAFSRSVRTLRDSRDPRSRSLISVQYHSHLLSTTTSTFCRCAVQPFSLCSTAQKPAGQFQKQNLTISIPLVLVLLGAFRYYYYYH